MENTVWFITGASRGLGRALTTYALKAGAKVVATARNPSSLDDLVSQYGEDRIFALPLDVTDNAAAQAAAQHTIDHFGKIDILINNAGYAEVGSVEDLPISSIRAQIDTNLFGVINVSKAFIPILRQQGKGHIFQISSVGSRAASPGLSAYQAAKYAVAGFSGVLAAELKPWGVNVTCLEPGAMDTQWAEGEAVYNRDVYGDTVGRHKERFEKALQGRVTKVERVGRVVERLYREREPPVRMLIGGDAVAYGRVLGEEMRKGDERWAELGESVSD